MANELTVIARNPQEMLAAQSQLVTWATNMLAEIDRQLIEAQTNYNIAETAGWDLRTFKSALATARNRYKFYEKMKAAADAGYVIVPNFPIDIFAIRTERTSPVEGRTSYQFQGHRQKSELPQLGEGEYVSDEPTQLMNTYTVPDEKNPGQTKELHSYFAGDYQDVGVPFANVKPQILDEVGKAMALRIFDEIGVLPARRSKSDPMVVGQIVFRKGGNERRLSFLITWWLSESHLLV